MQKVDSTRVTRRFRKTEGWFCDNAATLFGWIDELQKNAGITGDIFEIGCHHGKSAVLLGAMVRPETEKLAVCDLFGDQSDNVSKSGAGDLGVFEKNMSHIKERGVSYSIFQKNSTLLTAEEIGQNYRFFHVDGGHNPDEALTDLTLAAKCLHPQGVIALDDPFRSEWPGVTEALIRFLDKHPEFQTMIVSCNKVLLARKRTANLYLKALDSIDAREQFGFGYPWKLKALPFHESSLRILYVPDYRQKKSVGNLIRSIYYATPLPKIMRRRAASRPVAVTGTDLVAEKAIG